MEHRKLKIWYREFDDNGNVIDSGTYHKEYEYYGNALRVAHKVYGTKKHVIYKVAMLDPFAEHFTEDTCDICGKTYNTHLTENGFVRHDHGIHMHSRGAIPPTEFHTRYSQGYCTCPDCIIKIEK